MPAERQPLLSVEGLNVTYATEEGPAPAVGGVSFAIGDGEIVGLVGESGSGKSQTLLAIMGLLDNPNVAISGSIRFIGRELIGLRDRAFDKIRGGSIAMIFQDPMSTLTPVYTIGAQIVEQIRAHERVSRRAAARRAIELLDAVGIVDPQGTAARYPHQLSGGTNQRAVIAMALSCRPRLLIADEPTTALDVTVQAQILELIGRLRDDLGSAVILVTHDLGIVAGHADRVMVMYAGRIVEECPTERLFARPMHPYTQGLLRSIPSMEGSRPAQLPAIPGAPPRLSALPSGCAFGPRCPHVVDECRTVVPVLLGASGHRSACLLAHPTKEILVAEPSTRAAATASGA